MLKGDRLRELRKEKGLSADEAAAQLQMGRAQLLNYENNKTDPSTDVLLRLIKFYKVTADYLLGLSNTPNRPIVKLDFDPASLLNAMSPERAARFIRMSRVPVEVYPVDVVELLHAFPPETVAEFLNALGVDITVTALEPETLVDPEPDDSPDS